MTTQTHIPFYKKYQLPLFIGILLLTFIARLHNIDAESLWVDEGFSYWAIRHPDIWGVLIRDVHPPFYFVSLRLWASVTDISEFALRYFSVLPSILSVAGIYHVAREIEKRRSPQLLSPIPLLASLMLALADMETAMAQEVRMYTWHVLWVVLSAWGFLRFTRLYTQDHALSRRVKIAGIGWLTASVLLLYTQYVGLAFIGVQGLFALIFLRGKIRLVTVAGCIAIGASFIPWGVAVVLGQTANVGTGFNVPSTLASLWNWRANWFTQQWALVIGLALMGLFYPQKSTRTRYIVSLHPTKDRKDEKSFQSHDLAPSPLGGEGVGGGVKYGTSFFMLMWIVAPVTGAYILNFYTPILMDYRLTQITPAIALLIAFGLGHLRGKSSLFIVAVLLIYGVVTDDTAIARPPFRDIGQFVAKIAQPDDLLLAHVTPSGDWQMVYYYERYLPTLERRSLRQWQLEEGGTYYDGLRDLLNAHNGAWLMHWSSDTSSFEALTDMGYIQTAKTSWAWVENSWLDLYRFDRVPDATLTHYANGMGIRQTRIDPSGLFVEIWWSADIALAQNYTVSVILLDETGRLVAQNDSYPFLGENPTSTWITGEVVYDPHTLQLIEGLSSLPVGTYTVGVKIYLLTDTLTIQPTDDGAEYQVIGEIQQR
ncbi:MAG: hypothetical protein SFZ02_00595 [bacterium]|nr:hypothetical protein [bacterium]